MRVALNNLMQNTGNATYAGATAAISANVVLVAYIVVAYREDQADRVAGEGEGERSKKTE